MDLTAFEEAEETQYAVIKNFEIIGEAAYHLPRELREAHPAPAVEWRKITAFRHILVHDYYKINLTILWNAKEEKLETLAGQVKLILAEIPDG